LIHARPTTLGVLGCENSGCDHSFARKLTLRTANVGADQSSKLQYKGMPIGEYVLVEVEDTGTGIASEIIDKIFDPFYTTKDIGKGTGLGLSTVYGIVKQTGGFIYVDSAVGKGTTFRIFLPRYIPEADDLLAPPLPETTAPAIAGAVSAADEMVRTTTTDLTGHGTILLVEDEEGLRALNARGLISRGYNVIEAGNGVEAIEALEREGGHIDLVVSDVDAGDGRAHASQGAAPARSRDQVYLRVGLCRGRLPEKPAESAGIQFPGQAFHAQAACRQGEGNHGGIGALAANSEHWKLRRCWQRPVPQARRLPDAGAAQLRARRSAGAVSGGTSGGIRSPAFRPAVA